MTNEEYLKSLSIADLAETISKFLTCDWDCPIINFCDAHKKQLHLGCKAVVEAWLKEEKK